MTLKQQLYQACQKYVETRIRNSRNAMEEAQRAANEESKSSVGDKFETTRAMMQLERDKHAVQLSQAMQVKQQLASISPSKTSDTVNAGSLVSTEKAHYYIGISAGKIVLEKTAYYCISIQAPIAQAMRGKRVGDAIVFNGKQMTILQVI